MCAFHGKNMVELLIVRVTGRRGVAVGDSVTDGSWGYKGVRRVWARDRGEVGMEDSLGMLSPASLRSASSLFDVQQS